MTLAVTVTSTVAAVAGVAAALLGLNPRSAGSRLHRTVAWAERRVAVTAYFGGAAAVAVVVSTGVVPLAAVALGVLATLLAAMEVRRSRAHSRRLATIESVDESVGALAGDLQAGRLPAQALKTAAEVQPLLFGEAARLASWGADPVPALRAAAVVPGASALREVAAAWQVSSQTGGRLADVLLRARASVHDDLVTARETVEQIAPVRATARVLAVLPVFGVAIGAGLGVNVAALLVGTAWGQACLLGALLLVGLGLSAVDLLARRAAGW